MENLLVMKGNLKSIDSLTNKILPFLYLSCYRHGYAVFSYPAGVYEGYYAHNKRHGNGKETDTLGNIYEGIYIVN